MLVVKHWNKLPKEVVDSSSQKTFKIRLDGAVSNLIWLKMSLLIVEGLDLMTFECPFQSKLTYESTIHGICYADIRSYLWKGPSLSGSEANISG